MPFSWLFWQSLDFWNFKLRHNTVSNYNYNFNFNYYNIYNYN